MWIVAYWCMKLFSSFIDTLYNYNNVVYNNPMK